MDPKTIETISQDIYRRFPEVAGVRPKVRKQPIPKSEGNLYIPPEKRNYLVTFTIDVKGPGGQVIPRWVRVVVSPKGKIIKTTTSK